jgi:DNA-binding MarR family transcriptional regulator
VTRDTARLAVAIEGLLAQLVRRRAGEMEPSGFTTTQQLALAAVVDDGPLRLRELAEAIGTTKATATRSTDVLEAAGLVERLPDPEDGRSILIRATRAGLQARRDSLERLATMLERLLLALEPEERFRFVELVSELDGLLAQTAAAPARPV